MSGNEEYPTVFKIYIFSMAVVAIVTNLGSIIYIVKTLKVSEHVKRILLAIGIQNILASLLVFIGSAMIAFLNIHSFTACSLMLLPYERSFPMGIVLTALLSGLRYFIAHKTSKNRAVNHDRLKQFCYGAFAVIMMTYCCYIFLNTHHKLSFVPGVATCSGTEHKTSILLILSMVILIVSWVTCLTLDIAMINFIRQRSRVQPVRLQVWTVDVPLRSGNGNDLSDNVPVNSTLIHSCMIVIGVLAIGSPIIFGVDLPLSQVNMSWGVIWESLQLPLLLVFTVRSQDKKKALIGPPQGLQFHDPSLE